jgi:aromatic ring-opening dioxygenase LigB subunit
MNKHEHKTRHTKYMARFVETDEKTIILISSHEIRLAEHIARAATKCG